MLVTQTGSKLWRYAYNFDAKQKLLAIGQYPLVSLADARTRRDNAKRLPADGIDPSVERKLARISCSQIPSQLTINSEEMAILITGCVSCPRERPSPIFSPGDGFFVVRRNKGRTQSERTYDLLPCGADSAA
jgi:hypothetical protein